MSTNRDEELKKTPLHKADPAKWPDGVRQIGIDEMDFLGIDRHGVLHWNGDPVLVQKGVTLSFWQGLATFFIVLFTAVGGIGAAVQGWVVAHQWSSPIKYECPQPAPALPPAAASKIPLFLQRDGTH